MEIRLKKRKLIKYSGSYGFTVPIAYVRDGFLDSSKSYDILINERKEGDENTRPAISKKKRRG